MPSDQPRRARILGALAHVFALRGVPAEQLDREVDKQIAEATALGWQPLVPAVLVGCGNEYLRRDNRTRARELFKRALASFPKDERHDIGVEGSARLGLLEASMHELENPGARMPVGMTDPTAKPVLHDELARLLTSVTSAVGSDPMLAGARAVLAAELYADLGQYNRYKHAYEDALHAAGEARKQFESIGDVRRAASASRIEALIDLARGDERALDDALFAARRASDALDAAQLAALPELDEIRATVAFARHDYTEAHRLYDHLVAHVQPEAPALEGHTAPNAHVVAWHGELVGDPHRAYIEQDFAGDVATADANGHFTIRAEPGWAILAETGGARSTPQLVPPARKKHLELKLAPLVTVSGTVKGPNLFGVRAYARYAIGASHWIMQVPVDRDGSFDLRGLPPGARTFGLAGAAGTGERTTIGPAAELAWPHGQAIEIVVRAKQFGAGARAWLFRGKLTATTRAELDAAAAKASDVATSALRPIGSDNTDAGRDVYRTGDRHAVITGNDDDDYTACASADAAIACRPIQVKHTVVVEYPDGRSAAGVTPIVFEL